MFEQGIIGTAGTSKRYLLFGPGPPAAMSSARPEWVWVDFMVSYPVFPSSSNVLVLDETTFSSGGCLSLVHARLIDQKGFF